MDLHDLIKISSDPGGKMDLSHLTNEQIESLMVRNREHVRSIAKSLTACMERYEQYEEELHNREQS